MTEATDFSRVHLVEGTAIPLRGDDIDTDRIIPARFLRSVRFEGLEDHIFEDDRTMADASGDLHPFSNPAYRGASILLVNRNFGSGSSREHAPQGLHRWGIRTVVGESFSEIFFGNCVALGMPCLTVSPDDAAFLLAMVEQDPAARLTIRIDDLTVRAAGRTIGGALPRAVQESLLTGVWDATGLLLQRFEEVETVASRLPYVHDFRVPA